MATATSIESNVARGTNFVLAREYVIATHGEATWTRVLAGLTPEHRRTWEAPVTVGTYDFEAFKAAAAALARETGQGDETLARMYAYIADRSLNGLYKVFFRLANPAFVLGNFPRLWTRFFTAGSVQVPLAAAERAELCFAVPETFLGWLGPACLGYSTRAIELAGGRQVRVRERERRRRRDGEWEVVFDVTWREGA